MAGINVLGKTNTGDYILGRGCVMLSPLNDHDTPGEYTAIGNANSLTISADSEFLEHFSSKAVARTLDLRVAIETTAEIEIVIDSLDFGAMATFFVGETGSYDNTARGSQDYADKGFIVPNTFAYSDRQIGGRWYEITGRGIGAQTVSTDSHGQRYYDIANLNFAVAKYDSDWIGTGTGVVYTEGTDYELDTDAGMIFIVSGQALETDLTTLVDAQAEATDEYVVCPFSATSGNVSWEIDVPTSNLDEMRAFTSSSQSYAVKYLLLNAADNGHFYEVQIHKARFAPTGDLALLQEDALAELTLSGSAETNTTADPNSGFITIRTVNG